VHRVPEEAGVLSSSVPLFSRSFILLCGATILWSSAHYLVLTAIPVFLTRMGFATGFVGAFVGAFAILALMVRFPVGIAVDRLGSRAFGAAGAGLLAVACLLYALVPSVPARLPFAAAMPLLLPIAGIAHGVGFGTYGTSASSFVAYAAPVARRGEAVGYYGVLLNVAKAAAAGVSLLIVAAWGFFVLLGMAAAMAGLAAILWLTLADSPRPARGSSSTSQRFRFESKVLVPALVGAAMAAGAGVALAFVPLVGLERGVANPGIYFTAVAFASILFRIVAGRVADSYGRSVSIIPGMFLVSAGLMLVAHATSTEMLALAGAVCGIGLASADPALQALVMDVAEPDRRGSAMATYYALVDLGVSAGSAAAGQLVPVWGYGGAFTAGGCAPLVGLGGFVGYTSLGRFRKSRGKARADGPS
jgi:MFS family permease